MESYYIHVTDWSVNVLSSCVSQEERLIKRTPKPMETPEHSRETGMWERGWRENWSLNQKQLNIKITLSNAAQSQDYPASTPAEARLHALGRSTGNKGMNRCHSDNVILYSGVSLVSGAPKTLATRPRYHQPHLVRDHTSPPTVKSTTQPAPQPTEAWGQLFVLPF